MRGQCVLAVGTEGAAFYKRYIAGEAVDEDIQERAQSEAKEEEENYPNYP